MTTAAQRISIVIILLIAAIIIAVLAVNRSAVKQLFRGVALEEIKNLYPPETKQLGDAIIHTYREYRGNTMRWSAAYFGCLFGSAFFSAVAALLLKLEVLGNRPKLRNDAAAALATVAALLVTLSTTGDFQRKWHANRIAASGMENLAYDLLRPAMARDLDAIVARIQRINEARNMGIVGDSTEGNASEPATAVDKPPTAGGQN